MKKIVVLGVLAGAIVLLLVSAWLVNARFSNLEAQIAELKSQNSELENQNSALRNQTLQLKDRVKQLLEHRDEVYDSAVQITFFNWFGGFNPYVGLTLMYPVNVTIHNDGDVDARGLSLAVRLINMYDGGQIGIGGGTGVDTLLPGETREIATATYASLDESLADAACVVTLKQGSTVVDEWIRSIG